MSLARALKSKDPSCQVVYIGLKGDKTAGLKSRYDVFDKTYYITSGKLRRYHGESMLSHLLDVRILLSNFRDFFKVLAGTASARQLLKRLKPDVVFSKGGYVVVPVGIAARLRKIPIITHDSDTAGGLANRIIGRWATIHATGMPPEYYDYPKTSIRYTGTPIDERIKEVTSASQEAYKKEIGAKPSNKVLLIGGAGLGSLSINERMLEIVPNLLEAVPGLEVFHFTGDAHQKEVASRYSQLLSPNDSGRVRAIGFKDDFYKYSSAADVVLSRAGATTIAELSVMKKAAILIPAQFLTGGHQLKNASYLEKVGGALVIAEDTEPQKLQEAIEHLLLADDERRKLAENIGRTAHPDAAQKLAEIILGLAAGKAV